MRTRYASATLRILFAGLLVTLTAQAQIPRSISYQGVLADATGNFLPDGIHTIQVSLFESLTGGAAIFTETHTTPVVRGIFNLIIGSVTPLPGTIRFDRAYFLEVRVDGSPLTPRTPLTSVPYAMRASAADLADGLSPTATGAVRSVNGAAGSLTLEGAGGTTVTRSGGTITITSTGTGGTGIQGVSNSDGSLTITSAAGPIAGLSVADAGITSAKIAKDAVTSEKIADGTITGADINSGTAVTLGKLTVEGNVSVGTAASTSRLTVQGGSSAAPGSSLNVMNSAGGSLLYVRNDGNVGVGTPTPTASLEVAGANGLHISGGVMILSAGVTPAGGSIAIPPNRSVVRILDDGTFSPNNVIMPPGAPPGQILIITNEDAETTSGGAVILSGQTRMYVAGLAGFWRPID